MLARLRRTAEDVAELSFDESKAAFAEAHAAWLAANAELEALKVLNIRRAATDAEWASDRYAWARQTYAEHWDSKQPPAAWRIPDLEREVNERIELAHPQWMAAQDAWEQAKSRETSRIAKSLQARQRVAVRKIAAAVTALSQAMAEERELHEELARTSPNGVSAYLPTCSPRIRGVGDWRGELFAWRQRVRALGILD